MGSVTEDRQAVRAKGVSLPVLAAICLGVAGAIIPTFLRRPGRTAREAEQRERELRSIEAISAALSRATDAESIARVLLDEIASLFSVELVGAALVDERSSEARGVLGRREGEDFEYFRDRRFDLRSEPSGIASAVFEVAPVTVYDTLTSPLINQAVAQAVGAQSAAFIPLLSGERVIAVLVIATTRERRAFSTEELGPLRTFAAEAALALERAARPQRSRRRSTASASYRRSRARSGRSSISRRCSGSRWRNRQRPRLSRASSRSAARRRG